MGWWKIEIGNGNLKRSIGRMPVASENYDNR